MSQLASSWCRRGTAMACRATIFHSDGSYSRACEVLACPAWAMCGLVKSWSWNSHGYDDFSDSCLEIYIHGRPKQWNCQRWHWDGTDLPYLIVYSRLSLFNCSGLSTYIEPIPSQPWQLYLMFVGRNYTAPESSARNGSAFAFINTMESVFWDSTTLSGC